MLNCEATGDVKRAEVMEPSGTAPGAPGITPSWCRSAKDMVGCSLGTTRLWFTMGHGIINEVYYPRIDIPQIRDLGFIVADAKGFWVEVKRLKDRDLVTAGPGIPAISVIAANARRLRSVCGLRARRSWTLHCRAGYPTACHR
jgi:hypothetical protein